MYKLTNLQEAVKDIRGIPFQNSTVKGLFAEALGQYSGENVSGQDKLLANSLGIDILKEENEEIEVPKEMVDLLKKAIENLDFKAAIYAQLIESIKKMDTDGK